MNNEEKKTELKKFIIEKENHNLVKRYYSCYYNRYKEKDWREQLRILFINVLNAGGIGNIKAKAESIAGFENKIKQMKNSSFDEFLKVFDANSYSNLFEKLTRLKQIGHKKAALFLRDVFYFGNVIKQIPNDLKKEMKVPVDIVITRTINSIFNKSYKTNKKAFDEINNLAKEIFPNEPILLEDLWFWGRFYKCISNKKNNDIPYCKFNKDLLAIDINLTSDYRKRLLEYTNKNEECPFKKICYRK